MSSTDLLDLLALGLLLDLPAAIVHLLLELRRESLTDTTQTLARSSHVELAVRPGRARDGAHGVVGLGRRRHSCTTHERDRSAGHHLEGAGQQRTHQPWSGNRRQRLRPTEGQTERARQADDVRSARRSARAPPSPQGRRRRDRAGRTSCNKEGKAAPENLNRHGERGRSARVVGVGRWWPHRGRPSRGGGVDEFESSPTNQTPLRSNTHPTSIQHT